MLMETSEPSAAGLDGRRASCLGSVWLTSCTPTSTAIVEAQCADIGSVTSCTAAWHRTLLCLHHDVCFLVTRTAAAVFHPHLSHPLGLANLVSCLWSVQQALLSWR